MKLYTSIGPNPRVVNMFLLEKGQDLPRQQIDLMGGENRRAPYLEVNPAGQSPALVLDDGAVLTEITAICEYLEERFPRPPLVGTTAEERAATRMWTRRVDLMICEPLTNGFRFAEGLQLFANRMRCLPEAAAGFKAVARDKTSWLDGQIAGRAYLAGDRFTLADIHLFSFLDFGGKVGQSFDRDHRNLAAWFDRVASRPSAQATAG